MKPNDISDDAWEAARERVVAIRVFTGEEAMIEIVARAIMAERERCAKVAESNNEWPQEGEEIATAIRKGQPN